MSSSQLPLTPFSCVSDYERVLDYFLGAEEPCLRGMGSTGDHAYVHVHLWDPATRRAGLGNRYLLEND